MSRQIDDRTEPRDGVGAVRLGLRFDAGVLLADVDRLDSEDWTPHFNPADYSGAWSGLALRGPAGATHPILALANNPGTVDWEDTAALSRCPGIAAALRRFHCPLQSVRLLSLAPGAKIREHTDPDLHLSDGLVRLHVPILTNPGVRFVIGGTRYVMEAGETWCMDGSLPHSVENAGRTPRIHLVLNCLMNDWLRERLAEARTSA